MGGYTPDAALATVRRELDNIRRAWQWGVEQRQLSPLQESVTGLRLMYQLMGLLQEGEQMLFRAIAFIDNHKDEQSVAGVAPAVQLTEATRGACLGALLSEVAEILHLRGACQQLMAVGQRLVQLGHTAGQDHIWLDGHVHYGRGLQQQGRLVQAQAHFDAAHHLAQEQGHRLWEAHATFGLGTVAGSRGNKMDAQCWLEQAARLYRQSDYRIGEGNALSLLSQYSSQDPGKVLTLAEQQLEFVRRIRSVDEEFHILHRLTILRLNTGGYLQACTYTRVMTKRRCTI